nr:WD repeat-containing protein 64 [Nothobranchius furzeri]
MLQVYKEKEEAVRRTKQVAFSLPALMRNCDQGVPIVNIRCADDGAAVTVREDGFICLWNPELKPQKTKYMFGEGPANRKAKWVSDFALMPEHNKLIMGTGDREVQMYDLFTLEPYCQISCLSTIPLTLDYSCTGSDECCLLYGDTEGCVTILLISSVDDTLRKWSKLPMIENIPNISIEHAVLAQHVTFVRWKVHHDWVTQAKYFHSFRAVVSSSNEETSSLVVGCVLPFTDSAQQLKEITEVGFEGKTRKVQLSWTPQVRVSRDQTVFSVHKGVKTFDLCQKHSLLVTGGMDRLVRMWSPYFSGKPKCVLKGHSAPIFRLYILSEDCQIFSVSVDGTAKIWHIEDQCCLFTAEPKASGIHEAVSAASYSPAFKHLYIAADCMALLILKSRPQFHSRMHVSHQHPVVCCGCSEELRQVVSCSQGSVAKVWDLDTGRQMFEFGCTDDLNSITCMTFDSTGRRLITGGRDGCLKIWNFNNGQCLKTLKKEDKGQELWDCTFLEVQTNFYVIAVGRDRKIHIYSDIPQESHHTQRSLPSWKYDLMNGHEEDILCVETCPPSLLATSSYDGEIIVWNVVSGCEQCRCAGPLEAEEQKTGLNTSVPSIIFLKNLKLQEHSLTTALLSSGVKGRVNLWNVLAGGKLMSSFEVSKFQQKITRLAQTRESTLLYAADQVGYIYIYNMEKFDPSQRSPRAEHFWRAHTNTITSLQIVDSDQVVLSSSADHTVRLWSAQGQYIGTFGQPEMWSVHNPSSWIHPGVPYAVLIDPLSMPDHEFLNRKLHLSEAIKPDRTGADGGELKVS